MISILDVTPLQENWDASLQSLVASLRSVLRTFAMTISVQGTHLTPSRVNIQLQDSVGNNLAETSYLRVRAVNNNGYANATNATIAVFTGTVVETLTASKDLVIKSNASGLIQLTCTDAAVETFQILIGRPTLLAKFADYRNSKTVVHA